MKNMLYWMDNDRKVKNQVHINAYFWNKKLKWDQIKTPLDYSN